MRIAIFESRLISKVQKWLLICNAIIGSIFIFIINRIDVAVIMIAFGNIIVFTMWLNRCKNCSTPLVCKTGYNLFFLDFNSNFEAGANCNKCNKLLD